eukprot:gene4340-5067_t
MPPKRQPSNLTATTKMTTTYTREDLENQLYKDVAEIAKKMGLKPKGKKGEIVTMILAAKASPDVKASDKEEEEEEEEKKVEVKKPTLKRGRGKAAPVEESDDDEEEEEEDEPVKPVVTKKQVTNTRTTKVTKVVEEEEEEEEEEEKPAKPVVATTTTTTTTTTTSTASVAATSTATIKSAKSGYQLEKWLQEGEAWFYLEEYISRPKIVAFDMDDTMIKTKTGGTFAKTRGDWQWWDSSVPTIMKKYHDDGYQVIVITNQGGIGHRSKFDRSKFTMITGKIQDLCEEIGIPCIAILAADKDGLWRKPNRLMFDHLVNSCTDGKVTVDVSKCMYIGDAAGRPAGWKAGYKADFASSDLGFALSSGIAFQTPEEFFLGEAKYAGPPGAKGSIPDAPTTGDILVGGGKITSDTQEMVINVGYAAAGKSTFSQKHFVPAGYEWVNRDTLTTPAKCMKAAKEALAAGKSVVIDNTNGSIKARKEYIDIAKAAKVPVRCFQFLTTIELAQHMNYYRERTIGVKHVPSIAYNTYKKNFEPPTKSEGFSEIKQVNFILNLKPGEEIQWAIPKPK